MRTGRRRVEKLQELLEAGHTPERAVRLAGVDSATASKIIPMLQARLDGPKGGADAGAGE